MSACETLFDAIFHNDINELRRLIELGYDVNIEADQLTEDRLIRHFSVPVIGRVPLVSAICDSNYKMVNALIEAGADVNWTDNNQQSLLGYATVYASPAIVSLIESQILKSSSCRPDNHPSIGL